MRLLWGWPPARRPAVGRGSGRAWWARPGAAGGVCRPVGRPVARATVWSRSPWGRHAAPPRAGGLGGGSWRGRAGVTGADVLALAGELLPEVSRLPCCGDVHVALVEALARLRADTDRYQRLSLADEARDLLAAYLVASGRARLEPRVSATVRGWAVRQDPCGLRRGLVEAAWYWRARLATGASDMDSGG